MSAKFDPGQLDAANLKRELDVTINQKLNINFTDRETSSAPSSAEAAQKALSILTNDIQIMTKEIHTSCRYFTTSFKRALQTTRKELLINRPEPYCET